MNKEQKQEIINEIVDILHNDAGAMYEAKGHEDEPRIALDEDYFTDAAESVFNYCENMFSQNQRKQLSGFKSEVAILIKQAIDNFNTKWTSHEEQVDGINDIAMSITFTINRHYSDRITYLSKEVDRLRLKEEELGNMLLEAQKEIINANADKKQESKEINCYAVYIQKKPYKALLSIQTSPFFKIIYKDKEITTDKLCDILMELPNDDNKKQHAIGFARYYISNKSIVEFNKDNDEAVYNDYLTTLNNK